MINKCILAAFAATVLGVQSYSQAGVSNFYITDSAGLVYEVDGNTLAATEVIQLTEASSIHEIMYLGQNQLMYNVFGRLSITNIMTGETEVVFNIHDHFSSGINDGNGLAMTSSGDIYVSMTSQTPDFARSYGALIDLENQTLTELAEFSHREFYLDNHQVEENLFLGADWNNGTIDLVDTSTGNILSEMSFGFDPVSFFEANGSIYVIAKEGGFYTYDYLNGSVEYLGDVTGAGSSIIGATVPTPMTLTLFSVSGLVISRRRRE